MPTVSADLDDGTFDLLADYALRNGITVPEAMAEAVRRMLVEDMLGGA
ncbi:hypothetical protein O8W32_03955 [Methanomassiliicoccales archaeon LGM-DZ1]|nr:hypothetical protein O8W32_03955 [Methanomassiliicoccales archaeon LGM-DZ1]